MLLGLMALVGCESLGTGGSFVLLASFTEAKCGNFARLRARDAALLGHEGDVQARVARDVNDGCLRDRN